MDQEGKPDGADAATTPDFSLELRVKPSEECLALHQLLLAADSAGDTAIALQGDFVRLCLEDIKRGPGPSVRIPRELQPGKPSRCKWLISQVDSGNSEYVVKLLYHCPEVCDTAASDSLKPPHHCRVPEPRPDCPALIAKLDTLDTASEEYSRLRHFLHHHCGVIDPNHPKPPARDTLPPPPKDTLHPPRPPHAPTLCDSIHVGLAGLDKASAGYAALKAMHDSVCHIAPPPKDTLTPPPPPPPPKDTVVPPPPKDTLPPLHPPKDTLVPPPHPPKDTLVPPPPTKDTLIPQPKVD